MKGLIPVFIILFSPVVTFSQPLIILSDSSIITKKINISDQDFKNKRNVIFCRIIKKSDKYFFDVYEYSKHRFDAPEGTKISIKYKSADTLVILSCSHSSFKRSKVSGKNYLNNQYEITKAQIEQFRDNRTSEFIFYYGKDTIKCIPPENFERRKPILTCIIDGKGLPEMEVNIISKDSRRLMMKRLTNEQKEAFLKNAAYGNKVYISSQDIGLTKHMKRYLRLLAYWEVTDDIKDADFVISIKLTRSFPTRYFGSAVLMNSETMMQFYRTKTVNTWSALTWRGKRKIAKKLVYRQLKKDFLSIKPTVNE